jgi:hypothetical protein
VSRSYAEAFGYEADELIGEPWHRFCRTKADALAVEEQVIVDPTPGNPRHGKALHPWRDGGLFYADHHLGVSGQGLVLYIISDLEDAVGVAETVDPVVTDGGGVAGRGPDPTSPMSRGRHYEFGRTPCLVFTWPRFLSIEQSRTGKAETINPFSPELSVESTSWQRSKSRTSTRKSPRRVERPSSAASTSR